MQSLSSQAQTVWCSEWGGGGFCFHTSRSGFHSRSWKTGFFFFKKKGKEKKGHANFSSVFLEGNGRCVDLSSPRPSPTPNSDLSRRLQLWLRSEGFAKPLFFFTTPRCRVLAVSANDVRKSRGEEHIGRHPCDCFFFVSLGLPRVFVLPGSCRVQKGDSPHWKSHWGFPAFWTAVLASFKCKHTNTRRVPHQHTFVDNSHSLNTA